MIIPARGGSKRLPRKNIMLLDGRPVLAHVVQNGLDSGLFSRVIVSTEDAEIADLAAAAGAELHRRPEQLARDRSTVDEVCLEVLSLWPAQAFCCVYATAALLRPASLCASYDVLAGDPATDFVMGVSRYHYPPVQALRVGEDGFATMMWPEFERVQSQFHPQLCVSNGTLYWARTEAFTRHRTFYGTGLKPFYVAEDEVCDVNTERDFERMQAMYEARDCRR